MNRENTTISPLALSIGDAAKAAGISRSGIYSFIRDGNGPVVTHLGGRRVIRTVDLEAWLAGQSQRQGAAA